MTIEEAFTMLKNAMRDDPEYAWAWHCNLAMPIMDAASITHECANMTAAHLMSVLFECDITKHPHFEYGKSPAQWFHEFRLSADRAEDAEIAKAAPATR